tara:strand:- start:199 stop:435 length:237 start_codon:yes stop_codon:yes gene_type:complete
MAVGNRLWQQGTSKAQPMGQDPGNPCLCGLVLANEAYLRTGFPAGVTSSGKKQKRVIHSETFECDFMRHFQVSFTAGS